MSKESTQFVIWVAGMIIAGLVGYMSLYIPMQGRIKDLEVKPNRIDEGLETVQGRQGEQGPRGETGPAGPKGEKGETGPRGEKGDRGDSAMSNIPIGSIIAWHKNILVNTFPGEPSRENWELDLGDEWVECNGDTLERNDYPELFKFFPDDVIEIKLPDLNKQDRFLRGGSVSGKYQEATGVHDTIGGFMVRNAIGTQNESFVNDDGPALYGGNSVGIEWHYFKVDQLKKQSLLEERSRPGGEFKAVRPVNMSVTWIMRVK